MVVVYFQNDDQEYVSWLERHPNGYVLNIGAGGKMKSMLHRTRCSHLYPPDPENIHTASRPKGCSHNRDELEQWSQTFHIELKLCPDCGL